MEGTTQSSSSSTLKSRRLTWAFSHRICCLLQGDNARNQGFSRPWIRCCSYMIGILFSFYWYNKKTYHADYKYSSFQVRWS